MAVNNVGIMPLHAASLGGHAEMGRLLLENGTEVDAKVCSLQGLFFACIFL